ncbi:MAG: hypothetical protein WD802_11500 [Gemmatimonadaceae bacterium]
MERGLEQLIIIVAIILAGVLDLILRWLKGRQRRDEPVDAGADDEHVVLLEEADIELPADFQLPEEAMVEGRLTPPPPPPAPEPVISRRPPPPPAIRPRRVARRLLPHPLDARRGIVMMTVLGPCRGLQPPDSDAYHSH